MAVTGCYKWLIAIDSTQFVSQGQIPVCITKMLTVENTAWVKDEWGILNLRLSVLSQLTGAGSVWAFITPRPHYCDRGHWHVNVDCLNMELDSQDAFPRYYFDLDTAKAETIRFINWRVWRAG